MGFLGVTAEEGSQCLESLNPARIILELDAYGEWV